MSSVLRTDILSDNIKEVQQKVKVELEGSFAEELARSGTASNRSVGPAKNIFDAIGLIKYAIQNREEKYNINQDARVNFTYEEPNTEAELETISVSITEREPGAFGRGAPMENKIKNLKPIFRESLDDENNPGYKKIISGYFYDNIVTLTTWARTNKQAIKRAIWLEGLMIEYSWFFGFSGIDKIVFQGWDKRKTKNINGNPYYGIPLKYYIKTEKLWESIQKTLEEITIRAVVYTIPETT